MEYLISNVAEIPAVLFASGLLNQIGEVQPVTTNIADLNSSGCSGCIFIYCIHIFIDIYTQIDRYCVWVYTEPQRTGIRMNPQTCVAKNKYSAFHWGCNNRRGMYR